MWAGIADMRAQLSSVLEQYRPTSARSTAS